MLRIATTYDFPAIKELVEALQKETVYSHLFKDFNLTEEIYNYYISEPTKRLVVVVEEEGNVVGFAAFDLIPWTLGTYTTSMARTVYIYLKPEFRGKGYGKQLNEAFEYWGKKVGAKAFSRGITKFKETPNSREYVKVEEIYMKEVE